MHCTPFSSWVLIRTRGSAVEASHTCEHARCQLSLQPVVRCVCCGVERPLPSEMPGSQPGRPAGRAVAACVQQRICAPQHWRRPPWSADLCLPCPVRPSAELPTASLSSNVSHSSFLLQKTPETCRAKQILLHQRSVDLLDLSAGYLHISRHVFEHALIVAQRHATPRSGTESSSQRQAGQPPQRLGSRISANPAPWQCSRSRCHLQPPQLGCRLEVDKLFLLASVHQFFNHDSRR